MFQENHDVEHRSQIGYGLCNVFASWKNNYHPDDTRSSLLSEDQLAQIQTISTRSVEELVAEIAGNAARAAVEAMSNSPPQ